MIRPIIYDNNTLKLLDQRKLPFKQNYCECTDLEDVVEAIRDMKVRGAPAIGVAAAFGFYFGMKNGLSVDNVYNELFNTRPTAVNLKWALDRMKESFEQHGISYLEKTAMEIFDEDIKTNKKLSDYGASLFKSGDNILTHCNAGALATAGYGTALGVIRSVFDKTKNIHVYVDETRPFFQGSRLTSFELHEEGIEHTVICDNMAGFLMNRGMVDKVIVGADRIACNGDAANKIGTYQLAVLSDYHNIPFYIAAPVSSIDFSLSSGEEIPIEYRDVSEVAYCGDNRIVPDGIDILNPAFDVTPHHLITAFITEKGIFQSEGIKNIQRR
ncbi:MAG: S-methyl-5-thioribose-1-phosphate isomerase [Flexistipes sinusarabici]|uniref:Methylthioribose-1-phosphate isomerase n=1 Tax=Flexistipes sinusarabici TaxID=2352 RepID=A0A5D0MIH6_FLESI|nr:S-methyl-5-thioribose-1-phosphate isomerase [Flexistipes sinusarabici]TYB33524.1 MAG: S-methyl-5-thioribose-1-phosphate isomerase [Flexistipes sinusarabici]